VSGIVLAGCSQFAGLVFVFLLEAPANDLGKTRKQVIDLVVGYSLLKNVLLWLEVLHDQVVRDEVHKSLEPQVALHSQHANNLQV